MRRIHGLAVPALSFGLLVGSLPGHAAGASPQTRRGKLIYVEGKSASGRPVVAGLRGSGVEIDASVLRCSSCHGRDGRGRAEGGVIPSNITWSALTKPYGVRHAHGRQHPPYSEDDLARAITQGVDPAGNPLHVAMPRYRLADDDLQDLIAYLKDLGNELDPGLSQDRIRIGTVLPLEGRFGARGQAIRSALEAYVATTNDDGGIHSRKVELMVEPLASEPGGTVERLRKVLEGGSLFALAAVFMAGAEAEISALVSELEVPLVGPFTLDPKIESALNRHVFYLYPGLGDHARALVDFATGVLPAEGRAAAVFGRPETIIGGLVEAIESQAARQGWPDLRKVPFHVPDFAPLAEGLDLAGVEALFLLGTDGGELALMEAATARGWEPVVLLPGALAGRRVFELAAATGRQVFLSYPTLPIDRSPVGLEEYRRLAQRFDLPAEYRSAQLEALSAASVLVEGLKRAGRDLTREGLVIALETLREYDTGWMRPVTYGPNRRVGSAGTHVVPVDMARGGLVQKGVWIEPR